MHSSPSSCQAILALVSLVLCVVVVVSSSSSTTERPSTMTPTPTTPAASPAASPAADCPICLLIKILSKRVHTQLNLNATTENNNNTTAAAPVLKNSSSDKDKRLIFTASYTVSVNCGPDSLVPCPAQSAQQPQPEISLKTNTNGTTYVHEAETEVAPETPGSVIVLNKTITISSEELLASEMASATGESMSGSNESSKILDSFTSERHESESDNETVPTDRAQQSAEPVLTDDDGNCIPGVSYGSVPSLFGLPITSSSQFKSGFSSSILNWTTIRPVSSPAQDQPLPYSSSSKITLPAKECKACSTCPIEAKLLFACNVTHDTGCACPRGTFYSAASSKCVPCTTCAHGYGVWRQCSASRNTVCRRCPPGTYSGALSHTLGCILCTTCKPGQVLLQECNRQQDTVCVDTDRVVKNYMTVFNGNGAQRTAASSSSSASSSFNPHQQQFNQFNTRYHASIPQQQYSEQSNYYGKPSSSSAYYPVNAIPLRSAATTSSMSSGVLVLAAAMMVLVLLSYTPILNHNRLQLH